MDHLDVLESQGIYILREAYREIDELKRDKEEKPRGRPQPKPEYERTPGGFGGFERGD